MGRLRTWFQGHRLITTVVVLALVLLFPIVFGSNRYYLHIATLIGIYTLLSLGLNLITGFTGILTFAQASFAGIGAYTTALLLQNTGVPWVATVPLSIIAAAVGGLALALCTGAHQRSVLLGHHNRFNGSSD